MYRLPKASSIDGVQRQSEERMNTGAGGMTDKPIEITMVASEMFPFAKSGGLGDVIGALPLALGRMGHKVCVYLPAYRSILREMRLSLPDRSQMSFRDAHYEISLSNTRAFRSDSSQRMTCSIGTDSTGTRAGRSPTMRSATPASQGALSPTWSMKKPIRLSSIATTGKAP